MTPAQNLNFSWRGYIRIDVRGHIGIGRGGICRRGYNSIDVGGAKAELIEGVILELMSWRGLNRIGYWTADLISTCVYTSSGGMIKELKQKRGYNRKVPKF